MVPEWNGYSTCCMENRPPCCVYNDSKRRPAGRSAVRKDDAPHWLHSTVKETVRVCYLFNRLLILPSMIHRHLGFPASYSAPGLCGFAAVNRIWAKLRQQATAVSTLLAASGQ